MSIVNTVIHAVTGSEVKTVITSDVIVPDVSFWQDRNDTARGIDFAMMNSNKASGVIIRAGQNTWDDEDFRTNWKNSKGIMPRGAYWFYDSRSAPLTQAARLADLIRDDLPEMEVWADFEENYGGPFKGWRHFAVFVAEVQRLLPTVKIGIYSGYFYWLANSPNPLTEKASLDWFAQFPLWLAWYNPNPSVVQIPKPWKQLLYWQYVAKNNQGLKYGVESADIDLSYFQGTPEEFKAKYNSTQTPPPPPVKLTIEERVTALEKAIDEIRKGTFK